MNYTKQMLVEVRRGSGLNHRKLHHFQDKRWEGFIYRILRTIRFRNWKLVKDTLRLLDQGYYLVEHCSYNRNTGYRVTFDDVPNERSRWWNRRQSPIEIYLLKKANSVVIPLPKLNCRWEFEYIMLHNNTMLVADKYSAEVIMGNAAHKNSCWSTDTLWEELVSKAALITKVPPIPFKEEL